VMETLPRELNEKQAALGKAHKARLEPQKTREDVVGGWVGGWVGWPVGVVVVVRRGGGGWAALLWYGVCVCVCVCGGRRGRT
jgi:CDP-diglyceride synthetase